MVPLDLRMCEVAPHGGSGGISVVTWLLYKTPSLSSHLLHHTSFLQYVLCHRYLPSLNHLLPLKLVLLLSLSLLLHFSDLNTPAPTTTPTTAHPRIIMYGLLDTKEDESTSVEQTPRWELRTRKTPTGQSHYYVSCYSSCKTQPEMSFCLIIHR